MHSGCFGKIWLILFNSWHQLAQLLHSVDYSCTVEQILCRKYPCIHVSMLYMALALFSPQSSNFSDISLCNWCIRWQWQWHALCSTMPIKSTQIYQTWRRSMSQRPSKTTGSPEDLLEAYITATTAWTGHTHRHNNPPLHCQLSETICRILVLLRICNCFWPYCTLRQTLVRLKGQTPSTKSPVVPTQKCTLA